MVSMSLRQWWRQLVSKSARRCGPKYGWPDLSAAKARRSVRPCLEALEAGSVYRTSSLVPPSEGDDDDEVPEGVTLGRADPELAAAESRMSVRDLLRELPHRARQVLYLRFFDGCTQSEIAEEVGVSQVHVSRILRTTLRRMRQQLAESA